MNDTTDDTEIEDLIRYDILAQEALRGVVRKVLQEAARTGLPGEHHFYITFDTGHAGVRLSSRMREKYPDEMTIVIQHQFWDLETTEHSFSIGLSFDGIPETMLIPFPAVTGFFDPSVQFGLQFDADVEDEDEEEGPANPASVSALPSPVRVETDKERAEVKEAKLPETEDDGEAASADVVSLDAFRKK
ncbi:SspB family protein [Ahrensia sp. R2A130]|uniref:SspB family protein n=1 Tax=Ahrensia sp. R2A130 TaxID=744979 RepID=UPI0001E0BC5C|nr:ClpXP protease specificity-enhancing factor SspB [Ahrensia sp. R2A130]EFL90782.1 conserved hypothetical protein [Ahrensia sp. R2A130]